VALLADRNGNVLARGVSGSSNANAVGFDAACSALESAIDMARSPGFSEPGAVCLGLAGAGRTDDRMRFQNWAVHKYPKAAVTVVSDAEILLVAGAPSGPALALICGTGSIVYGRMGTGELIRAGGWGYLFGDEGSGYTIGSAALRAVMQAYDGRGAKTSLSELVLERYGLHTAPELVSAIYGAESPRLAVASLTDLVEQAAGQEDPVAIAILKESAGELARTIAAVYPRLGSYPVPLIMTGGTILHGGHLRKEFFEACQKQGLEFAAVHTIVEPAEGALKLAARLLA
jgi:N-acetylglucosamine kinase-like BadF-type ATPase